MVHVYQLRSALYDDGAATVCTVGSAKCKKDQSLQRKSTKCIVSPHSNCLMDAVSSPGIFIGRVWHCYSGLIPNFQIATEVSANLEICRGDVPRVSTPTPRFHSRLNA